jgi:hypothetical protein
VHVANKNSTLEKYDEVFFILYKTFKRMVNARLAWFLESTGVLTELQSGFHKGRSTTDQIVRLEGYLSEPGPSLTGPL